MRTFLRGKITLLFMMLGMLVAVPTVAFAADLLTEAELSSDVSDRTEVAPNDTENFTIKVWARGNLPSSQTGNSTIVNAYTMGSTGTITPNSSSTTAVKFQIGHNYGVDGQTCPATVPTQATGVTGKGCASEPFVVPATLVVGAVDAGKTGTLTVGATGSGGLGITSPASCTTSDSDIIAPNTTADATDCSQDQGFVEVVNPDQVAPTSTASATVPDGDDAGTDPDPYTGGTSWTNKDVTVSLNATDNAGGSGVKELTYSATGADPISPAVTKAAANLPTSFTIDAEGTTTISYFAKDNNNNVETAKTFVVKIDKTAPTVAGALAHTADHNGWYNAPVGYTFANSSSDELSGINASSCTSGTYGDSATEVDGTGLTVSGSCSDNAGNSANGSTPAFDYDNTDPTNVTTTLDRAADHGDWYNAPVGWTTDGTDVTSDIASCDTGTYSGPDGTGKTVSGKCTDNAGNASASVASAAFDFDNTNPTQPTFSGIQAKTYAVDDLPAEGNISCSSTDVTSPPADCAVTGYSSGFGSHTLTGTATDQAGNTNSNTLAYIVGLQAGQVLSPINSASKANPLAKDLDAFKIKSTIPVKFQLYNDALMQHLMTSPPAGSTAKLSFFKYDSSTDTTDGVDVLTSGNANTGDIFRWDSMSNQYVYNLATTGKTVGTYGVQLTLYDSSNTVLAQSAKYYFVLK
jgi:hypothetical protein